MTRLEYEHRRDALIRRMYGATGPLWTPDADAAQAELKALDAAYAREYWRSRRPEERRGYRSDLGT